MGSMGEDTYDVIVVGGGFSGAWHLKHLRDAGFKVHLYERGGGLGGIWWHNCYPGARVDTECPVYQFTSKETWETWNWHERYPGRDELTDYFKHIDKVWDLSKDVSYNTSVENAKWDESSEQWVLSLDGPDVRPGVQKVRAAFLVLCTGFASQAYVPPWKGIETFQGQRYHTSSWPQEDVDLEGKRVGVIGTGATGVQVIQEVAKIASHLTVFQRTPNTALPMGQRVVDKNRNEEMKSAYRDQDYEKRIKSSFAGFLYDFNPKNSTDVTEEEKIKFYEELFTTGGLHFWLGTYKDVLYNREANEHAYQFWRQKTLQRIKKPEVAAVLAPEKAPHPFGTKRVSLEQNFFEAFNQDNVTLVDLPNNAITEFTPKGIKTADGVEHELDVVILATGFDSISGSVTQIDIRGMNGLSMKDKWADHGVDSHLGMTTNGFPNLFYVYGPQAPTAFATGPSSAEAQGEWILACLLHMRDNGLKVINPTVEAEKEWRAHTDEIGYKGLFPEAKSWYFGSNIPGKPHQALNYMAGMPTYKEKCWTSAKNGYAGFVLA